MSPIFIFESNAPRPRNSVTPGRYRAEPADFAGWELSDFADFWVDPRTGVSYSIATETPQYRADTLQDLVNIPVTKHD